MDTTAPMCLLIECITQCRRIRMNQCTHSKKFAQKFTEEKAKQARVESAVRKTKQNTRLNSVSMFAPVETLEKHLTFQ